MQRCSTAAALPAQARPPLLWVLALVAAARLLRRQIYSSTPIDECCKRLERSMPPLKLPSRVLIQLVDENDSPVCVPNVLFRVTAFASYKNDFHLGPFASDGAGIVTITKSDLDAGIADCYESGLMDYSNISGCSSRVEIRLLSDEDIRRAIDAREKIWTKLLPGERTRWKSIGELLNLYKSANNARFVPDAIRMNWSEEGAEYSNIFAVAPAPLGQPEHR